MTLLTDCHRLEHKNHVTVIPTTDRHITLTVDIRCREEYLKRLYRGYRKAKTVSSVGDVRRMLLRTITAWEGEGVCSHLFSIQDTLYRSPRQVVKSEGGEGLMPGQYVAQELSCALAAVVTYTFRPSSSRPSNMLPASHASMYITMSAKPLQQQQTSLAIGFTHMPLLGPMLRVTTLAELPYSPTLSKTHV